MGLDMYLHRKQYVSMFPGGDAITVTVGRHDGGELKIKSEDARYIIDEVGYWRKSNHIHQWFVQNVQGGTDDCGYYRVTAEHLQELLGICDTLLASLEDDGESKAEALARELLPTQGGFFFGSTDYADGYFSDLQHTAEIIRKVLPGVIDGEFTIYYSSSW